MYVFTAHVPGDYEAPLVAFFDKVPTVEVIADQLCNTVPHLEQTSIVVSMKGVGIDDMLACVEKVLAAHAAAGNWPSIGKLSEDGGMYFSMQLIVDRPKNRN